jgi:hypothetical protein
MIFTHFISISPGNIKSLHFHPFAVMIIKLNIINFPGEMAVPGYKAGHVGHPQVNNRLLAKYHRVLPYCSRGDMGGSYKTGSAAG